MTFLEGSDQAGLVLEGGGSEGQEPIDPGNQPSQQVAPQLSPYGQKFLEEVPEEERGVIQKYLPKWDGGFTKYAQQVQGQLKQYQDLGQAQELAQMRGIYQRLMDDPQGVMNYLVEQGHVKYPEAPQSQQQNGQQEADPYAQKFQTYDSNFQRLERALGMMAETFQKQQQAAEQAANEKQLDDWLALVKGLNKNVDEEYALTLLHSGMTDPNEVVGRWNQKFQSLVNASQAGRAPNVMGSSSQPPIAQKTTDMTPEQRRQAFLNNLPADFLQ